MIWTRRILLLLVLFALAGCAIPASSPPPRAANPPRTRCLTDPNETGTRPLLFFFCIESP
jgi:hypothetical protein